MPTYGFRIRFLLPEESAIDYDAEILDIPLPSVGLTLVLRSVPESSIRKSRNLTIRGSGFPSEDEARACGRRTKNALMLCGARLRMGIDVGKDWQPPVRIKGLEAMDRYKGVRLLPDVHGLSVFPEDKPVDFPCVKLSRVSLKAATEFVEELGKAYEIAPKLTDKQSLALELYGAAHFESSLRARFLTLVIAVECLSTQEEQPQHVLDHLKELMELTEKSLEAPKREEIVARLGNLKRESISESCRELVGRYLGPDAVKLFKDCYDARGKIVHDGEPPEDFDLGSYTRRLDKLVSQLLIADATSD